MVGRWIERKEAQIDIELSQLRRVDGSSVPTAKLQVKGEEAGHFEFIRDAAGNVTALR
jgi:hypothetical protein